MGKAGEVEQLCANLSKGHCSNSCPDVMSQPEQNRKPCTWGNECIGPKNNDVLRCPHAMAIVHVSRWRSLGAATWWPTWVGVILVPDNSMRVRFGHIARERWSEVGI